MNSFLVTYLRRNLINNSRIVYSYYSSGSINYGLASASNNVVTAQYRTYSSTPEHSRTTRVCSSIPVTDLEKVCLQDACRSKKFGELLRAYLVFGLCSFDSIVDNQAKILGFLQKALGQRLFHSLMRQTLYKQFMIGETEADVVGRARCMRDQGVLIQMGYTGAEVHGVVKSELSPSDIEDMFVRNYDALHQSIEWAANAAGNDEVRPKTAFKITFLMLPGPLENFNSAIRSNKNYVEDVLKGNNDSKQIIQETINKVAKSDIALPCDVSNDNKDSLLSSVAFHLSLYEARKAKGEDPTLMTEEDVNTVLRIQQQMTELSKHALERDVRILWDAEQSYLQDAIDVLVLDQMRSHNRGAPVNANTYQCYRTRTLNIVSRDVAMAEREGFKFAAKIVRGAYIVEERRLAKEQNYEDPINPDYDATSAMYYSVVDFLLNNITQAGAVSQVTFGSHNIDTVKYILTQMHDHDMDFSGKQVALAQTVGMRDYITYPLAALGLPLTKQYHYGPVADGLAWLSRRVTENRGGVATVDLERQLIGKEIKRRLLMRS